MDPGRDRSRVGVWLIFRRVIVACEIHVGRKMCLTPWFTVREAVRAVNAYPPDPPNRFDLSRTTISRRALSVAEVLPALQTMIIDGIAVGWWAKYRLNRLLQRHRKARPLMPFGT